MVPRQDVAFPMTLHAIRFMSKEDIPTCVSIEATCYPPAVCEGSDFFHRFWEQNGSSCWVATTAASSSNNNLSVVVGYALSLPTRFSHCPLELGVSHDDATTNNNDENDTVYLHDLAVALWARRQGIGNGLFQTVLDYAASTGTTNTITLAAVCGAWDYWERRHGFGSVPASATARQRLESYPKECGAVRMMQRPLLLLGGSAYSS